MIVNLNTMCKVKLNEQGKAIWMSQLDQIPEEILQMQPDIVEKLTNMIDENNYVESELWTIMNVFGPYISQVSMPFETSTIQIMKNPNFGNHS